MSTWHAPGKAPRQKSKKAARTKKARNKMQKRSRRANRK